MSTFRRTTSINKILALKGRVKVIQGGTSAGKTFAILPILIDKAAKTPGSEISVVSESIPHLRRGALKDFIKIMHMTGRWNPANYNRTLLTYVFANGSYIEFFSADDESKLRGARRTHLFINECNNIDFESYNQLAIRTSGSIYLDFNPVQPFWVHDELIGMPGVDFLKLTYKDNEALPDSIRHELESKRIKAQTSEYWANWCRVYLDGEIGSLQGVVFNNWSTIKDIPAEAKLLKHGLDFGFSFDPMAGVTLYQWNGKLIIDEWMYQTGVGIGELIQACKALKPARVVCDNSQPMLINELRKAGILSAPCVKGKDSINYGISKLQEVEMLVTNRSVNVIKELRGYVWDGDEATGVDHAIDAIRYAFIGEQKASTKGMVV